MYAEYCMYHYTNLLQYSFVKPTQLLMANELLLYERVVKQVAVLLSTMQVHPWTLGWGEVVLQSGATSLLSVFQNCHHVLLQINSFHSSDMLVAQTPSISH